VAWQSVEHSKHSLAVIKPVKDEILSLDCTVSPSAQLTLCLKHAYKPKHWIYEFRMGRL